MDTVPNNRRPGRTASHFSGLLMADPAEPARVELPPPDSDLFILRPALILPAGGADLRGPRQQGRGRGDLLVIPRAGSDLRLSLAQEAQPERSTPTMGVRPAEAISGPAAPPLARWAGAWAEPRGNL